ncbi:MAG: hypothetical protein Q9181_005935 [Wetmoreana brouardii]
MTPLSCLLYLLGIHVTYTLAGQCLSICRDPDDCPPEAAQPGETPPIWQTCPGGPGNGAQWACQASDIDFPTVACLVADMQTCGLIGAGGRSTVFYSFGATTVEARTKFRDTLNPKGVMFNDALDADYWDNVLNLPKFHMDQSARMTILVARYAEAMATVSTGEVFFVVQKYNGDGGGHGAYQLPTDTTNPNVWRAYEFPTLQRNPAVTRVTSVDLSNNQNQHVDWQPNNNDPQLPASGASDLVVPPPPPGCPQKVKRAAAACVTCITFATPGGPTGTVSVSGTAPATASITPAPTISCTLQNEDPDQGINTEYCVCSGSTFPVLSVGTTATGPDASCAYTTLNAASTIHPTANLPVVTRNCQVCTVAVDSEQCTPLAGCTPTAVSTPKPTPPRK